MKIFVPMRTTSPNKHLRETRSAAIGRKKTERAAVTDALAEFTPLRGPVKITVTRVSPPTLSGWKSLDSHDNLRGAVKTPVDAIAKWLGVDDANPSVSWHYAQRQGEVWGLEIEVERGVR